MQQRNRRAPSQRLRVTDEDMLNEGEYDDVWPARLPTSTRRYQNMPDVRTEAGRRYVDAQPPIGQRFYAAGDPYDRRSSIPPRRTPTQPSLPPLHDTHPRHRYT